MQRENTLHRVSNRNTSVVMNFNEEEVLGVLSYLDKESLERLNDHDDKLDDLVNDLQQVKDLAQDKEMLIASNKSLAEYNLKLQPRINQGREYLAIQYEKASKLKEEYDTLRSVLDSSTQGQSLDTTHALLQTKAAQSEEDTDRLSELFLDKSIDCEEFLDKYLVERTETHLLKVKCEKLGEMIQQHVSHGTWGGAHSPHNTVTPPYPTALHGTTPAAGAGNPPYPMHGSHAMPQLHLPPVSN